MIILTVGLFSCDKGEKGKDVNNKHADNYEILESLYHHADTVIRSTDTLIIINTKLDTTIIETGIFAYLQYDYPLTTPPGLIDYAKTAIQYEDQGNMEKAENCYKKIIDFYTNERPQQFDLYSDLNDYLQYAVNAAILCSFAYEKLGDNERAIKILQPLLANVEARQSKIQERYIQLCIHAYGMDKVRMELDHCGKTIQFKKQDAPEYDDWVVQIFGADIGLGNVWEMECVSPSTADSLVRGLEFYKMIQ
ncbi:MAG: hypothetical protein R2794_11720 [Chitinophagales bacterium]